jgi:hypothetical protein
MDTQLVADVERLAQRKTGRMHFLQSRRRHHLPLEHEKASIFDHSNLLVDPDKLESAENHVIGVSTPKDCDHKSYNCVGSGQRTDVTVT